MKHLIDVAFHGGAPDSGGGRVLDKEEEKNVVSPRGKKYKGEKFPLSRWEFVAAFGVFLVFSTGLFCIYLTMPTAEYQMLKLPRNLADLRLLKDHLATYAQVYPATFILGYCSTYIFMQTFRIPGTIFMSLLAGALFGVVRGLLLVVFNATAGNTSLDTYDGGSPQLHGFGPAANRLLEAYKMLLKQYFKKETALTFLNRDLGILSASIAREKGGEASLNCADYFASRSFALRTSSTSTMLLMAAIGDFLMKLSVGTPPFEIMGILDTGSVLTWTQCAPCELLPSKAASFHSQEIVNFQSAAWKFENSANPLEGVAISSTSGTPISQQNIVFGCGYENLRNFIEEASGVIGLGPRPGSLVSQMNSVTGGKFSYCLLSQSRIKNYRFSKIHFGSNSVVSGAGVISTGLHIFRNSYVLRFKRISVGKKKLGMTHLSNSSSSSKIFGFFNERIIVDSGTILTHLPKKLYQPLEEAMKKEIKLEQSHSTFGASASGIVGLGGGKASLITKNGALIRGKFSYCLVPHLSEMLKPSKMNFGDKTVLSGHNMVTVPIVAKTPDTYFLTLEGISVGNQRIDLFRPSTCSQSNDSEALGEGNIIIDSRTTLTFLLRELYDQVIAKVKSEMKLREIDDPQGVLSLCYLSIGNAAQVPEITVLFKGVDLKLKYVKYICLKLAKSALWFCFCTIQ
ncbi:putative membrane protein [Sesamum alatum]|uniref:Membrane protein n=1 Tax=Sesamum alatum TaxID=300844 RepID=A0AAE1Y3D0_9LAMI|nr:putative membrane protein [Sesamum alatum]